jgi:3-(3-hydroxy-phenyl)propionate hydroxylase
MRKAALGLALRHPEVRSLINPRQTSAITYGDSPLNATSDAFDAGPVPGQVLLECPLTIAGDGAPRAGYLTDLLAPAITALVFGDAGEVPPALRDMQAAMRARGLPVAVIALARRPGAGTAFDHTGRLFPLYGAAPGTIYLVRPDGHVLGRWHRFDADACERAIEGMLG